MNKIYTYICDYLWQHDFLGSVGSRRVIFLISKGINYQLLPICLNSVFSQIGSKETCFTGYLNVNYVHVGQRWSMLVATTLSDDPT